MSVNRFSQRKIYNQFNPLSMQELMVLPGMKQQQHDQALEQALAQKLQFSALQKDNEDAQGIMSDMDNEISGFTNNLMDRGLQSTTVKDFLTLKQKRDFQMGPQGDAYQIQANLAAFTKYEAEQKKRFLEGKIDKTTYENSIKSSLQEYQGYKQGGFQGYTPSDIVNGQKKGIEIADKIKRQVMSAEKWEEAGRDAKTGHIRWEKNGHTTTTTPAGTDQLILNAIASDPEIQGMMRDEAYFLQTLTPKDELGNYLYNGKSWNPEEFANTIVQDKLKQMAAPGIGVAYSGQGSQTTHDIKFIKDGTGGSGYNPNGVGITEDPGTTPQYLKNMNSVQLDKAIAEAKTPTEKSVLEYYKKRALKDFENTEEGQASKNIYTKGNYTTPKTKLEKIIQDAEVKAQQKLDKSKSEQGLFPFSHTIEANIGMFGNNKEYSDIEIKEALNYYKQKKTSSDKFDEYLKQGLLHESKVYKFDVYNENARKKLNDNFKVGLDAQNYDIVGVQPEGQPQTIEEIKSSKGFKVETANLFGEYSKPTFTVRYTDDSGKDQTVQVQPKGLRTGNIPNSTEAFINYFTEGSPDIADEFYGGFNYHDIPVGIDIAEGFDYNKGEVMIDRRDDGSYVGMIYNKDGTLYKTTGDKPSKTQAINDTHRLISEEKSKSK